MNLLGNSVKFTPVGSVEMRASHRHDVLEVEIQDTGVGIEAEEQHLVFQMFEQTSSGLQSGGGTGLGLALSRKYAENMGGTLNFESRPGVGTTFYLRLPLKSTEAPEIQPELPTVEGLAEGERARKILVADDDAASREVMQELLSSVGFEVECAVDGADALARVPELQPDAVIVEYGMAGVDGFETSLRLKKDRPDLTVMLVTADVFGGEKLDTTLLSDIFFKPVIPAELLRSLGEHLGIRYRYRGQLPRQPEERAGLKGLPAELRLSVQDAAKDGDHARLLELLEQVKKVDSLAGARLSQLLDDFDYSTVLALL